MRSCTVAKTTLRYFCFAAEVVLEVEILLLDDEHVVDLALVTTAEERLHVVLAVGFGGEEEVRRVLHLSLEGLAVLL